MSRAEAPRAKPLTGAKPEEAMGATTPARSPEPISAGEITENLLENLLAHVELIRECLREIEKGKDPKIWGEFAKIFLNGMEKIIKALEGKENDE